MSETLLNPTVERIAIATAATAALVLGLYLRRHGQLGPQADWLESLRRRLLPWLDDQLEEYGGYAEGRVRPQEFVARVHMTPEEFEDVLDEMGFVRNFAASLKTDPQGRTEVGSWALRDSPGAPAQLHAITFAAEHSTATDVYAHREASSQNPAVAVDHYRGESLGVAAGVDQLRILLLEHEIPHTLRDPPSESQP